MTTSFKAVVKFALLVCQMSCLTSKTEAFCCQKCHVIAVYSCVVQWFMFMFVYFILFFRAVRSRRDDCWMTRKK